MNRLHIINFINPSWHRQITEFLQDHPAFNKLIPIVALDEYPTGFNKNPHETDDDAPRNIFETIIYGLAHAAVDIDYGKSQYLKIVAYLRQVDEFTHNMEFPFEVEDVKRRTYTELINTLLDANIGITEMTYEQLHVVEDDNLECIFFPSVPWVFLWEENLLRLCLLSECSKLTL